MGRVTSLTGHGGGPGPGQSLRDPHSDPAQDQALPKRSVSPGQQPGLSHPNTDRTPGRRSLRTLTILGLSRWWRWSRWKPPRCRRAASIHRALPRTLRPSGSPRLRPAQPGRPGSEPVWRPGADKLCRSSLAQASGELEAAATGTRMPITMLIAGTPRPSGSRPDYWLRRGEGATSPRPF